MIFDYNLMFTDDNTAFAAVTNGVVGRVLDLGAPGQGKGRSARLGVMFNQDVEATGSVVLSMDTADDGEFTENLTNLPLAMPALTEDDMSAGSSVASPLPVVGMRRYCRLRVKAENAVTLTGMESGFLLDANEA